MSKTALAVAQDDQIDASRRSEVLEDLLYQLGGLDVINTIVNNLNAALIIRLQSIRDNHTYRSTGFQRFDDFMDNYEKSPMSYKRFNYIENIFKSLGAELFDLTAQAGLSVRQQKLLGKSQGVKLLDDGKVVITTDKGDVEIDEPKNARQWRQAMTILADANADKAKRLEIGAEDFRRERDKRIAAEESGGKNGSAIPDLDRAHMVACGAIAALVDEIAKLKPADCQAYLDGPFNLLATQYQRINDSLCEKLEQQTLNS